MSIFCGISKRTGTLVDDGTRVKNTNIVVILMMHAPSSTCPYLGIFMRALSSTDLRSIAKSDPNIKRNTTRTVPPCPQGLLVEY